jgi:hypothetical protein
MPFWKKKQEGEKMSQPYLGDLEHEARKRTTPSRDITGMPEGPTGLISAERIKIQGERHRAYNAIKNRRKGGPSEKAFEIAEYLAEEGPTDQVFLKEDLSATDKDIADAVRLKLIKAIDEDPVVAGEDLFGFNWNR